MGHISENQDYRMSSTRSPHKQYRSESESSSDSDYFIQKTNKHSCTDILCTLLFLIFVSGLVAVSVFAYNNGNPSDLLLPHDSEGRTCGKTEEVKDKPLLFFFDITKCISISSAITSCPTTQICVEECPSDNAYIKIPSQEKTIKEFCDPSNSKNCPSYLLKSASLFGRCVPSIISQLVPNTTIINAFDKDSNKSVPIQDDFNHDLTLDTLQKSILYLSDILNLKQTFEQAYEDLTDCVWIILLGLLIGAILAFLWMLVLRFIIKPMIWLTILVLFLLLGLSTYLCTQEYISLKNTNQTPESFKFSFDLKYLTSLKETWLTLAIIQGLIFLILFFVIISLRKRIDMAAELIKEVSKAIVLIPASLFWPFVPFILEIGIIVYCVSTALYLASSGVRLFKVIDTNLTNETNFTQYSHIDVIAYSEPNKYNVGDYCKPDEFYAMKNSSNSSDSYLNTLECVFYIFGYDNTISDQYEPLSVYYTKAIEFLNRHQWIPQAYVLFMLFWLTAFMMGLNEMTLAGSFGSWYWSRKKNIDKRYENDLPLFTVLGSLGRALFYHLGTIAFGSLIIALVKIIRITLEYLSRKLKPQVDKSTIARYLVCCLKCCFWALEKFIKFINRYAYIITAVHNLNFCMSAKKAFSLITSNALRVAVIDSITGFILFLSNLTITVLVGILSFFFFTKRIPIDSIKLYTPDLNNYFIPMLVIVLGVFTITKLFFDVFGMGVDTILMCVLIDLDENDGSKNKQYHMSVNLKKLLKISNKRKHKN